LADERRSEREGQAKRSVEPAEREFAAGDRLFGRSRQCFLCWPSQPRRVEILPNELPRLESIDESLFAGLRDTGYDDVLIDLRGYRSTSL
jgi:hypothetical protein